MVQANPGSLYSTTRVLLKGCKVPLLGIHSATGIPFYWLKKFSGGQVKDPSVNRVQALYEFLTGKSLEV